MRRSIPADSVSALTLTVLSPPLAGLSEFRLCSIRETFRVDTAHVYEILKQRFDRTETLHENSKKAALFLTAE